MNRVLATAVVMWLGWASAGATPVEQQRQDFEAAEQALAEGDRERFTQLSAALADYPLYPYLIYTDLLQRLDHVDAAEPRAFLQDYRDTPLAWQLRRRWLNQLAARGQWRDFLADFRPTSDITLQCQQLQGLIRTGQTDKALAKTEALWLHGSSRPKECDPAFTRWQQAGNPSPALAWKRIDLAMSKNNLQLARYLRRFLPAAEQAWVDHWLALHNQPQEVARLKPPAASHPYLRRMQVHAVRRLARRDAQDALQVWQALSGQQQFSSADRRRAELTLAIELLHEPGEAAARFFAQLQPGSADVSLHELRLRAALARGDWQAYLERQAELPPALRDATPWRYWQARALAATGQDSAAEPIYRQVAEDRSYHGFLAADRIGLPYRLEHNSAPAPQEELQRLAAIPALLRSHELFALGRMLEARREWHNGTRGQAQSVLVSAAKLAESWGWHDQAIMTIAQGRHWDDLQLRFPLVYRDAVEQQAERQTLDPAWVYAVVRQESAFMYDARSHVGATGLMQLMPATARRVAKRLPEPIRVNGEQLRQPALNITLGSAYLREVLDGLYDNRVLATAAYNAGPHRVRQWLPERTMEADLWVEMVPFGETRKYLQRVLSYTAIYQSRLGREPIRLKEQMPPIQPAEVYARAGIGKPVAG